MKRFNVLLLVILMVAFVGTTANAQLIGKGIKAGINLANLSGDDIEETDMKIGLAVGGFITYGFTEMFAVQPEVLFMMKGAEYTETDPLIGDITAKFKLNYIEIPVLVKVMIPTTGNVKPVIFAGPAVGFLMSANVEAEALGISIDDDIKDETKSIDFGLAFGAGVGFEITQGTITLDARYTLGLTTIDDTADEFDVKNGVISIMGGFSF